MPKLSGKAGVTRECQSCQGLQELSGNAKVVRDCRSYHGMPKLPGTAGVWLYSSLIYESSFVFRILHSEWHENKISSCKDDIVDDSKYVKTVEKGLV